MLIPQIKVKESVEENISGSLGLGNLSLEEYVLGSQEGDKEGIESLTTRVS